MKNLFRIILALAALAVAPHLLLADNFNLEIHSTPRKLDENVKKASEGGANAVDEHWIYEVTVENKTFKELDNLEVKYVIFFKQEQLGVKTAPTPRTQTGTSNIASLRSHEKTAFHTDPVELKKSNLVGNWHYTSGAKPNAHDTLVGIAIRVFQNGQQIAEYANPSNLAREKWE